MTQQNNDFWNKIKELEKIVLDRDTQISQLKSDYEVSNSRAQIAETLHAKTKKQLQHLKEDNETLKLMVKDNGIVDPLEWKRKYDELLTQCEEHSYYPHL